MGDLWALKGLIEEGMYVMFFGLIYMFIKLDVVYLLFSCRLQFVIVTCGSCVMLVAEFSFYTI